MKNDHIYRRTLHIALPIMIQNGVTNFVNMLDNIMVGQIGTAQMSGVAIVNQLMFVFNLCIFGGLAGIGIFTAQYFGKGNHDGVKSTFRLMFITALILTGIGAAVFLLHGDPLISLYLHGEGSAAAAADTLIYAKRYLWIMLAGILPFALTQVYSSVLRSCNETVIPMRASLLAVTVNLIGNYVLIYGKFGFPALGVQGAAAATVLSRFVELGFIAVHAHRKDDRFPYMHGVYSSLAVPAELVRSCAVKGAPLLVNEFLWSSAMATLTQIYSRIGLDVIAALNIAQTMNNLFNISFIALGSATGIIIGQELGAGHFDTVKRDANRITLFTMGFCIVLGIISFALSGYFPLLYKTTDSIRQTASGLIRIAAVCMPVYAYTNASYFILRSGGKTIITFLFDSCFCWCVSIPVAWLLVSGTSFSILLVYLIVQSTELIKCAVGFILVEKEYWINDLTGLGETA